MTTSVPPPLPMARESCTSRFPVFVAGFILGAALVGAGATFLINKDLSCAVAAGADAEAALARAATEIPNAGQLLNNLAGGQLPGLSGTATPPTVAPPAQTDAAKIKALGDEAVEDLRQGQVLAVYRLTTKEYQNGKKREDFEKSIVEVPNLSNIHGGAFAHLRESKVRKATEGDGYEYYCTASGSNISGNVVFSFIFVPGDNNSWRISDVQVNYHSR